MNEKKEKIDPSDFCGRRFAGSELRNPKKEAIARTIVYMSQRHDDRWFDFSFSDCMNFLEFCERRPPFQDEEAVLDALVSEDGILDKKDGFYSVNDLFFCVLTAFINPFEDEVPKQTH